MVKRTIGAKGMKEWAARLDKVTSDVIKASKSRRISSDRLMRMLLTGKTLFGPIDFGRRETAQTRALAHLLDPEKSDQGLRVIQKLLAQFAKEHGVHWSKLKRDEIEEVAAEKYVGTGSKRPRLDVYACGFMPGSQKKRRWELAIEAKIHASEGHGQLQKIEKALGEGATLIFLTKGGHDPSVSDGVWKPLSYARLVGIFLKATSESILAKDAFLRLYLAGLLRDIEDWPEWRGRYPTAPFEWLGLRTQLMSGSANQANATSSISHQDLRHVRADKNWALALWADHTLALDYLDGAVHEVIGTIPAPWDASKELNTPFLPEAVKPLFRTGVDLEDLLAIVEGGAKEAYDKILHELILALHKKLKDKVQTPKIKRGRRPYVTRQTWTVEFRIRPKSSKKNGKCTWIGVSVVAPTNPPNCLQVVTWLHFPTSDLARQFNSSLKNKREVMKSKVSSWSSSTICMGSKKIKPSYGKVDTKNIVNVLVGTITVPEAKRAARLGIC